MLDPILKSRYNFAPTSSHDFFIIRRPSMPKYKLYNAAVLPSSSCFDSGSMIIWKHECVQVYAKAVVLVLCTHQSGLAKLALTSSLRVGLSCAFIGAVVTFDPVQTQPNTISYQRQSVIHYGRLG